MKQISGKVKSVLFVIATALLVIGFSGCTKKILFGQSSIVPGAEGSVKITKDKNSNYSIHIDVLHLAEPKRLQPAKSVYLVWMQADDNSTKNIGILNSSSSLLSKTLKASLHTVTPFKPTRIYVTAEDDSKITFPAGETILTTGNL
ncbi:MAG: hypothetical protein LH478_15120 [Chitinophagaceae bacterium]|nr:hypothetical protein [Chitinophagaceae bacterium]